MQEGQSGESVGDAIWADPYSPEGVKVQALLRDLLDDRRHAGWAELVATLERRVAFPMAGKFPGVTDREDAASTLHARALESWFSAYLDAASEGFPRGQAQPLGRFLERRLRDHLKERLNTQARRDGVVEPSVAEEPELVTNQGERKRSIAEELVEVVEEQGKKLDERGKLCLSMAVLLKEAGYTQTQIGVAMGTSTPTVNRWFRTLATAAAGVIVGVGALFLVSTAEQQDPFAVAVRPDHVETTYTTITADNPPDPEQYVALLPPAPPPPAPSDAAGVEGHAFAPEGSAPVTVDELLLPLPLKVLPDGSVESWQCPAIDSNNASATPKLPTQAALRRAQTQVESAASRCLNLGIGIGIGAETVLAGVTLCGATGGVISTRFAAKQDGAFTQTLPESTTSCLDAALRPINVGTFGQENTTELFVFRRH